MHIPIKMFNKNLFALTILLLLPLSVFGQVTISNGVAGDGFWSVTVQNAGNSSNGTIDPVGPIGPSDVIFYLSTYYDNGMDGQDGELSANISSPAVLTNPGEVTSSGSFPGPNGTINWTAVSTIAPGSSIYQVRFSFTSSTPFGATRIINYLDEDVLSTQNLGVVLGTDGAADFLLLTVNPTENVGVSHGAGYFTPSNMTYAGWHMTRCCGAPSVYSVNPGQVTNLPQTTDARFPNDPVYGIADITSSFAFDFNPAATTASVVFVLGGSADGNRPDEGQGFESVPIPSLTQNGLLGMILVLLSVGFIVLRKYSGQS